MASLARNPAMDQPGFAWMRATPVSPGGRRRNGKLIGLALFASRGERHDAAPVTDNEKAPAQETSIDERPPSKAERAAAFDFLCQALSLAPASREPRAGASAVDWVALVEQANRERVVTNLHVAFRERGWPDKAPEDLRDYLALVYEANAAQNRGIRQLARDLGAILNHAGAGFAFLKGANWLLEVGEDRIGERWLADIDLVVAPAGWSTALGALEEGGFRPATNPAIYARHFHHVPLARPGDPVTIEVHRHLGWQRHLLTPEEVVAMAAPGRAGLPLASPAHRFIFGSLHAQLQNMEYAAGHFSLRDLCDIQYLAATQAERLDWAEIAAFARTRGIFPYLAASLHLCHRLLGLEIPAAFAEDPVARRHARRCLLQHRGNLRPKLTALAVKLAWLVDSRRLAYELDCEQAPWFSRQVQITGGRLGSVMRRLVGGRRASPDSPFAADNTPPVEP